ncbi:hypothetical protein AAG570_003199 [Ranatra chinensis]|uniref:LOV domain-containing protein n=1 Tax=Ranatra chinensis TaxID=642074 RepID=A0ABD0YSU2_9HEMI
MAFKGRNVFYGDEKQETTWGIMDSCFPPLAAGLGLQHATGGSHHQHSATKEKKQTSEHRILQDLDLYYIKQIAHNLKFPSFTTGMEVVKIVLKGTLYTEVTQMMPSFSRLSPDHPLVFLVSDYSGRIRCAIYRESLRDGRRGVLKECQGPPATYPYEIFMKPVVKDGATVSGIAVYGLTNALDTRN